MTNPYAVSLDRLESGSRVDRDDQVEEQATGSRPEPAWRGPVPPWAADGGPGGGAVDGDGD